MSKSMAKSPKWPVHPAIWSVFVVCVKKQWLIQVVARRSCDFAGFAVLWLIWTASSEFGTYCLCEQRRFRQACASAQSRQNLCCSLIEAVSQEEPSDRKPDPWPLWMPGHAQLKFVMTECSKTQIRLTRPVWFLLLDQFNKTTIRYWQLESHHFSLEPYWIFTFWCLEIFQ